MDEDYVQADDPEIVAEEYMIGNDEDDGSSFSEPSPPPKPKKSPSIKKAAGPKKKAPTKSAMVTTDPLKASATSQAKGGTRDFPFKQRFLLNYGHNEEYYQQSMRYKSQWQDKMFYLSEDQLKENTSKDPHTLKLLPDVSSGSIPPLLLETVNEEQFLNLFGLKGGSEIKLSLQQGPKEISTKLNFGEYLKLNDSIARNGLFLNAGGHVTSMKWLPGVSEDERYHYLATTVIRSANGIESTINDHKISLLESKNSQLNSDLKHGIQIWRFDSHQNHFSLYKFLLTTSIGISSDIGWIPSKWTHGTSDDDILGVLCGTFSDGKLHVLKINKNTYPNQPELANILQTSLSYGISDTLDSTVSITCYDFLGHGKIFVGLSNGSIAEFILPYLYSGDVSQEESDITIPSYVISLTEAAISSVVVGETDPNHFTLVVNSTGSQCFALEYEDFQHGSIGSWTTNSLIKPIYNKSLKLIVSTDSQDSLNYSFARHLHEKPTLIMKVDGTVTSYHTSEILNHPLALCGSSIGEVHVVNIARKILQGGKTSTKVITPLLLWKLSKHGSEIHISGDLVPTVADRTTKLYIAPPEVSISAVAWNENLDASSVYTAATVSGLIVLERLDPKFHQ